MLIQFANDMTLGIIKLLDKHVAWIFWKTKPKIECFDQDSERAHGLRQGKNWPIASRR